MKIVQKKGLPLKDQAYHFLKKKIITCELMPETDISEAKIAEEMSISRTPVREAILRLSQEGFIMIYPRKGMIVSPVTVQDIHEVFQIRKMVEPYIAVKNCDNISKEDLIKIKNKFDDFIAIDEDKPYVKYFDLDTEFHKYIIRSSNNKKLISFMDKIYDLDYRIRALSTLKLEDIEERSKPEHYAIIEGLLNNDKTGIEKNLNLHLDNALEAALRSIY